MEFHGSFTCKCGKMYSIDLGPEKIGELRTPRKISEFIAAAALMMARSCCECEKEHAEESVVRRRPG